MKTMLGPILSALLGLPVANPSVSSPAVDAILAPEWCSQDAAWSQTLDVRGAVTWTIDASLVFVASADPAVPGTLHVFGNLAPLPFGGSLSLYLPLPYPCAVADPGTDIPILTWFDPVLGARTATIRKPAGPTWPEAILAGLVSFVVF